MAVARDHIRNTDVTFWAIVTLVCWALAVVCANVSALLPPNLMAGLHASRLDGGTLNQLRGQVAGLQTETARLKRDNAALVQRFELAERQTGLVTRRVGALEVSVPRLLEALPKTAEIDRSAVTASIDGATSFEAEGGSVTIRRQPLLPAMSDALPTPEALPMPAPLGRTNPAPLVAAAGPFALALGAPVTADLAVAAWREIEGKVGPLLFGLVPRLGAAVDGRTQLLAGPLAGEAEALRLCERLRTVAIACSPAPYDGTPLPRD